MNVKFILPCTIWKKVCSHAFYIQPFWQIGVKYTLKTYTGLFSLIKLFSDSKCLVKKVKFCIKKQCRKRKKIEKWRKNTQ